jgi:nitrite reductase (NO-forming)
LRSWPQDAFRIGFGLIWLIDAVLKWLPGFRSTYVSAITGVAQGQPAWLNWWFDFWVKLQQPRPTFFAYMVAVLETLVALAIIVGFARKITYIASAVFGVVIWAVAEGFGGPYATGASDIGTAIIYAVVSMGLLTLCYYAGASRYSLDYHLEKRISWWWKVAEIGHQNSRELDIVTTNGVETVIAAASEVGTPLIAPVSSLPVSPEHKTPAGVS